MEAKFADVPASWRQIEPLIPPETCQAARWQTTSSSACRDGRDPVPAKLPSDFGSGSTCHLRFQTWVQLGVFAAIHRQLTEVLRRATRDSVEMEFSRQRLDEGAKRGDLTGSDQTDRAKS